MISFQRHTDKADVSLWRDPVCDSDSVNVSFVLIKRVGNMVFSSAADMSQRLLNTLAIRADWFI